MKRIPYNRIYNPPKKCTVCGNFYERHIGVPQRQWARSIFCSIKCKAISQKETGKLRKHSLETRMKMRASARKGADSHLWRGGVNTADSSIRGSVEYKLWRTSVFERDNYTCVWCKTKKSPFNADHIKPLRFFPELRFAIDNGRTLCVPCHKTTDTYGFKVHKKLWQKS